MQQNGCEVYSDNVTILDQPTRHSKSKWIFQEDLKQGKAATNDLLSNKINDIKLII